MPVEEVSYDKVDVVSCDGRGRATLGSEYANEQVWVYIAELPDIEEIEDYPKPKDDEYEVLVGMTDWAIDNGFEPIEWDQDSGVVKDKNGNEYQTPFALGEIPQEAHRQLSMETGEPMGKFESEISP